MRNFLDTFGIRKRSFISAYSICMAVPLKKRRVWLTNEGQIFVHLSYTTKLKNVFRGSMFEMLKPVR